MPARSHRMEDHVTTSRFPTSRLEGADGPGLNSTANRTMGETAAARFSRRGFLQGSMAATATWRSRSPGASGRVAPRACRSTPPCGARSRRATRSRPRSTSYARSTPANGVRSPPRCPSSSPSVAGSGLAGASASAPARPTPRSGVRVEPRPTALAAAAAASRPPDATIDTGGLTLSPSRHERTDAHARPSSRPHDLDPAPPARSRPCSHCSTCWDARSAAPRRASATRTSAACSRSTAAARTRCSTP